MLHIHNGDASANVLMRSDIAGDHLPWREALVAGPAARVSDIDEWCNVRSEYLAPAYGLDVRTCHDGLMQQERELDAAGSHEEIVLWFEHDLSCQTILIYLLDRLGSLHIPEGRISLVCIDRFPGLPGFRGLGELTPDQMASLFEQRTPVGPDHFQLAARAWQAYTSPDPLDIEQLLRSDTSALPFLGPALHAHLRRFPSMDNGLGAIQSKALELIGHGTTAFTDLFQGFGSAEPLYGYGDYQFWDDLAALARTTRPLIRVSGLDSPEHPLASGTFLRGTFHLTPIGEYVLSSNEDALAFGEPNQWLGGVEPAHTSRWRWDATEQRLRPMPG